MFVVDDHRLTHRRLRIGYVSSILLHTCAYCAYLCILCILPLNLLWVVYFDTSTTRSDPRSHPNSWGGSDFSTTRTFGLIGFSDLDPPTNRLLASPWTCLRVACAFRVIHVVLCFVGMLSYDNHTFFGVLRLLRVLCVLAKTAQIHLKWGSFAGFGSDF